MKIKTILTTKGSNVITIRPERTIKEAAVLLAQHRIGALVVVNEGGGVVGIVSERDVIREAAHNDAVLAQTVGQVMTREVVFGTPQDDVQAVLQTMSNRRFRHMPILDQGELVGVVSIGDLVKAQLDEFRGKLDTMESQMIEGEDA